MGEINVNLKGKNAIVTGATKGIGKAIAHAFGQAGARIIAMSRTQEDLEKLKDEFNGYNYECMIESCDIREVGQITESVNKLKKSLENIDILVNSAGLNIQMDALEFTEENWDKIMDINLKGSFFMSQAVAQVMKDHKKGKIINITSQMAFVGYYKRTAYCASKGGLTQASKALAVELAPYNINVNCVAPTFIKTPMTEPMFEDKEFFEEIYSKIPLKKVGQPKDVTGAVLYLSSDSADLVTGTTILVDGGWVAW